MSRGRRARRRATSSSCATGGCGGRSREPTSGGARRRDPGARCSRATWSGAPTRGGGATMTILVADDVARAGAEWIAARRPRTVALAGGTTPRAIYLAMAAAPLPWAEMHVYFGHERAAPPDDPESNYRMARETLLARAPIPPENVHRMEAERADLEAAAEEYGRRLPDALDLVILGMGEDGHTASLFPGR